MDDNPQLTYLQLLDDAARIDETPVVAIFLSRSSGRAVPSQVMLDPNVNDPPHGRARKSGVKRPVSGPEQTEHQSQGRHRDTPD